MADEPEEMKALCEYDRGRRDEREQIVEYLEAFKNRDCSPGYMAWCIKRALHWATDKDDK